jgi:transposase
MKYIQGKNRHQTSIFPISLDEAIEEDNEVRLIDLFVDSLNLNDYGFKTFFKENGRPAYHPSVLLKLYIYGYMNKIRSSRDLEKETKRNIEVMWLLNSLSPDHNTISNFRRDNPKALKKVFRATVEIAKHFELIGGKLIAGDSTKFRAQNSKKNNYNKKKINRHIEYIDNKLEQYNKELSEADNDKKQDIKKEIDKHNERKDKYRKLQDSLDKSGEKQISTTDPDSRQLIIRNNITEVAYNTQVTTDDKNCIPIDYKVTNENDSKAMGNMLQRAKSILRSSEFIALYDKGYHTGSEFGIAHRLGIKTMVAIPAISSSSQAPDPDFNLAKFIYNSEHDTYTCPAGQILKTKGNWVKSRPYLIKQYRTKSCNGCQLRSKCTTAVNGRIIERSEYTENVKKNRETIDANPDLYKKRQAIVEHPFGTIKRQWGFDHVMTKKTIERASADIGIAFIAYNLRRIINIVGKKKFREFLNTHIYSFLTDIARISITKSFLKVVNKNSGYSMKNYNLSTNRLILVLN